MRGRELTLRRTCYPEIFSGLAFLLLISIMGPSPVFADNPEKLYRQAEKCHERLMKSSLKRKFRQFWIPCLKYYKKVYTLYPDSQWAPAGLYQSGQLYLAFYQQFQREDDQAAALNNFKKVINLYPASPYKAKSEKALKFSMAETPPEPKSDDAVIEMPLDDSPGRNVQERTESKPVAPTPPPAKPEKQSSENNPAQGSPTKPIKAPLTDEKRSALDQLKRKIAKTEPQKRVVKKKPIASDKKVTVSQVRYSSNPKYTRVVIQANAEAPYRHHLLERDLARNTPERLYVDIENSRLGAKLQRNITINDDILFMARTGQFSADVVRVVMELKNVKDYNIFSLQNPFRIVIDYRKR